ncbi:AhpC-TSA-domain-containing protein [Amniculicola lignicola CBS 123094]|uniref:thioredoxin-dependent peroxiredoxin n=1 Tax=Amniculicola lignicola CBS 123094 TaxID=1392246 RepID=A0A6A5WP01_9PLEO|nr:AhpC-TSA-domain-containing protein [Amniculicola lignicola CBS 123094]
MVELRKRKTPPPAPVRPAKKKAAPKTKVAKAKAVVEEKVEAAKKAVTGKANGAKKAAPPAPATTPSVGDTVDLSNFSSEIETHDGTKTSLARLVEESKGGVVLFTYPKASTGGCTKQVCYFRDSYEPLTATGLSIYGLSNDSPKANTTFYTKQNLTYPLLCDPTRTLISAIGLKNAKGTTTRGIFVVDKAGKVLLAESGSPEGTVTAVKKLVAGNDAPVDGSKKEDVETAKTAGEVADTAAKIDA